jgi:hypothetical protein
MNQKFRVNALRIACMLLCLLLISVSGCVKEQNREQEQEKTPPSEELTRLLPEKTGFTWVYSGFAEYGHEMKLESITPTDTTVHFKLNGNVYDASGGEAPGDYSLRVEYQVTSESIIMHKAAERMMDNFSKLVLIRLPLQEGTQWEQKVMDKDGKEYHLVCTIQKVEDHDEGKVYTVVYKDRDSDFYEKRQLQEDWGVISFETIWQSPEGPVTIGYYLYREASGYPGKTALKAFLPPLGEQLRYFGLAEYAHEGQLVKVSEDQDKAVYQFNGNFQDGSGIPGEFKVQYLFDYKKGTIQEKVVENTRSSKEEVNSKLHHPVILKLPLEVGNTWQQEITFEGEKKTMTGTIVSIAYEGRTFYSQMKNVHPVVTVRYRVEDAPGYFQNMYVEERKFQKGRGMISFSNLMKGALDIKDMNDVYQIEQAIINHMFGYSLVRDTERR